MNEPPVKLEYEAPKPSTIPWQVSSPLWLAAALFCGWFMWLCARLASGQSDSWGGMWGAIAFFVSVSAVGLICLVKAVRPLFR
jgi:hypothetical protein